MPRYKLTPVNQAPPPESDGWIETAAKGAARGGYGILGGVGSTTRWVGDVLGAERLSQTGETLSDMMEREQTQGFAAADPETFGGTFMENPSLKRAWGVIWEAAPSLVAALVAGGAGMGLAGAAGLSAGAAGTVGAATAATGLGLVEGAPQYEEAIESGKTIGEASKIGAASTIGSAALEYLPFSRYLKGMKGNRLIRGLKGGIGESAQEAAQNTWQNLVAKVGYDETRSLYEGLVESIIGGFGVGGPAGLLTKRAKELGAEGEFNAAADDFVDDIQTENKLLEAPENRLLLPPGQGFTMKSMEDYRAERGLPPGEERLSLPPGQGFQMQSPEAYRASRGLPSPEERLALPPGQGFQTVDQSQRRDLPVPSSAIQQPYIHTVEYPQEQAPQVPQIEGEQRLQLPPPEAFVMAGPHSRYSADAARMMKQVRQPALPDGQGFQTFDSPQGMNLVPSTAIPMGHTPRFKLTPVNPRVAPVRTTPPGAAIQGEPVVPQTPAPSEDPDAANVGTVAPGLQPAPKPRKKGASTIRGRIKELGFINTLNFKGEFRNAPTGVKFLTRKSGGYPLDSMEQTLKDEGWMRDDESLLDILTGNDKAAVNAFLSRRFGDMDARTDLSKEEKRLKEAMEETGPEPPEGDYEVINAEDLPIGKKLTIIEGRSPDGWDEYEIIDKDPFGVTLKDGTVIELSPLDEVAVLKSDLAKPEAKAYDKTDEDTTLQEPARDYAFKPPAQKALPFNLPGHKPSRKVYRRLSARMATTGNVYGDGNVVRSVEDAASLLAGIRKQAQENVYTIAVDKDGTVLEIHRYSKGNPYSTPVSTVHLAGAILKIPGVARAYFIHNHPSGNTEPSKEDAIIADDIKKVLSLAKVETESLVIGGTRFRAFGSHGVTPSLAIRPSVRKTKIPVKERALRKSKDYQENMLRASDSREAQTIIKTMYGNKDGFLFLGPQMQVYGFMETPTGMKTREVAAEVISEAEATNASGLVFNSTKKWNPEREALINAIHVRIQGMDWYKAGRLGIMIHDVISEGKSLGDAGEKWGGTTPHVARVAASERKFYQVVSSTQLDADQKKAVSRRLKSLPDGKRAPRYKTEIDRADESLRKITSQNVRDSVRPVPLQNVTDADLKAVFPKATSVKKKGNTIVVQEHGVTYSIESVDHIKLDEFAFEIGYEREIGVDEVVAGETVGNRIRIAKVGDIYTLAHEKKHVLQGIKTLHGVGVFKPADVRAIGRAIGKENPTYEDQADWYQENFKKRHLQGRLGRLLQKIQDFIDSLVNLFHRTAGGVYRDIQSGKLMDGATEASGEAAPAYETAAPRWYSQMEKFLEAKLPGSGSPAQMKQMLESWAKKGEFKQEELEWSGVSEWLDQQTGKVTKQQVLDFVRGNNLRVEEVVKGEAPDTRTDEWRRTMWDFYGEDWDSREEFDAAFDDGFFDDTIIENYRDYAPTETKFSQWQLPGGENYRELLIAMPTKEAAPAPLTELPEGYELIVDHSQQSGRQWGIVPPGQGHARPYAGRHPSKENAIQAALDKLNMVRKTEWANSQNAYTSTHWDEKNVLAHVRFSERTVDGKKVLHIEEIQSDLHQQARKEGYKSDNIEAYEAKAGDGTTHLFNRKDLAESWIKMYGKAGSVRPVYGNKGIPDAPWKKTWPLKAFQRMVRYAAENGFDSIAWTPGDEQVKRYKEALQQAVDRIEWTKQVGGVRLVGYKDGRQVVDTTERENAISDAIGKSMGDSILGSPEQSGVFEGDDITISDTGMAGFYDKILPAEVNKFFGKKAWGNPKVGTINVVTEKRIGETITPELLAKAAAAANRAGDTVAATWLGQQVKQLEDTGEYSYAIHNPNPWPDTKRPPSFYVDEVRTESDKTEELWHLPITPQMKDKAIREGMPLYQIKDISDKAKASVSRLKPQNFFRRTGIKLPTNDPADMNGALGWIQTQADLAKNHKGARDLFDVQQKRIAKSNSMSVKDREDTEAYFALPKSSMKKVNVALSDLDVANKDGVTDAYLASKFGLSEDEIAGFRAVRKKLDEKLDILVRQMLEHAIEAPVTQEMIDVVKMGLDKSERAKRMKALGVMDNEFERIHWVADWVSERKGYVPHKWKEPWRVWAKVGDETFMFDVPSVRGKIYPTRELRQGAAMERGVRVLQEKLGLTEEQIRTMADTGKVKLVHHRRLPSDLFGNARMDVMQSIVASGTEKAWKEYESKLSKEQLDEVKGLKKQIQENIEELFLAKGWGQHLIGRKGVKGYRTDLENVIAEYLTGFNSFMSKGEAAKEFAKVMETIDPRETPVLWKHSKEYVADMLGDSSEAGWFKRVAGTYFLAADLSAAALNGTQNWTHAVALLRKIEPKERKITSEQEIASGMKDVFREYTAAKKEGRGIFTKAGVLADDEILAIKRAHDEGALDPAFFGETTGLHENKVWENYGKRAFGWLFKAFTGMEGWNRTSTFLAAYRRAKRAGLDPFTTAVETVNEAHFVYGKGNRPQLIRKMGAIGNIGYTFMTYPINNLVFLKHRAEELLTAVHKGDKKAVKQSMKVIGSNMGYLFAFGGLMGLPFWQLGEAVLNLFADDDDDWEVLVRKHTPKTLGRAVTRGLPAAFLGNDMSWRVQGTDVIGMPIGFQIAEMGYKRAVKARELWEQGEEMDAFFHLMPDLVRNPYKAMVGLTEGGTRKSAPPIKYTPGEAITKGLGFTPTREAETWAAHGFSRERRQGRLDDLANFAERLLAAWKSKDPKDMEELRADIKKYNDKQKAKGALGIPITWKDVRQSARQRRRSRTKGLDESLPKYMRGYQKRVSGAFGLDKP